MLNPTETNSIQRRRNLIDTIRTTNGDREIRWWIGLDGDDRNRGALRGIEDVVYTLYELQLVLIRLLQGCGGIC